MKPDQAGAMGSEAQRSSLDVDRFAVSSRRQALDRLWAAFEAGLRGPVLVTGEPGAGKSWLVGRFAERLPAGWRSAEVEMTSALDGLEMLRLIGDPLGLEMPDRLGAARLRLGASLREASADGRSWLLIVDEVQRATAEAREEIEALCHQLGRAGGFAALILLGRTELVRELAAHRRQGWANRLGLHIHLPPLDLDEARALVRQEGHLTGPALEALHRDAMGNPRAMLRMAAAWGQASRPAGAEPPEPGHRAASPRLPRPLPSGETRPADEAATARGRMPVPSDDAPPPGLPSLIPARPPIRFEEGLVEVGWEGDLDAEPTRAEIPPSATASVPPGGAERGEELVEDRYAALQAWAEWSRNRERAAPAAGDPAADGGVPDDGDDREPGRADPPRVGPGPVAASSVRAEPPQDFAPYSQLFSRLRHSL